MLLVVVGSFYSDSDTNVKGAMLIATCGFKLNNSPDMASLVKRFKKIKKINSVNFQ